MKNLYFETDCNTSEIHLHKDMEVLYVLQGRCAVFLEGKNFVLKPEDFAVFNPFESHQLYREEGAHTLSLYIPVEILTKFRIGTIECISPLQPDKEVNHDQIRMRLAELFRDCTEDPDRRRLNILAELLELLNILQQDFIRSDSSLMYPDNWNPEKHERKQKILRYIWEHYQEPLTLKKIAKEFYLSEGHLSRIFHNISGSSFSAYLRNVRLIHARQAIRDGIVSVTEIALSSGFGSVNTFISAFKKEYGETPGSLIHRYKKESQYPAEQTHFQEKSQSYEISYMSLMHYRTIENKDSLLYQLKSDIIQADLSGKAAPLNPLWKKLYGIGYAKDVLFEVVQSALTRSLNEIGFESVIIHGIFSDELGVCTRNTDGSLRFNFVYVDLILDFLIEKLHVTPWIMLDYTPLCLIEDMQISQFGDNNLTLPANLEEWSQLIQATLKHMVEVYGKQRVSTWKFSVEQAVHISFRHCSMEDYKVFYMTSYRIIRSVLPSAEIFAFGLDTGHVCLPEHRELEELLLFSKVNDCIPDLLSFQSFFCDYSKADQKNLDISTTEDISATENEIYPLSEDENILSKELDEIQKIMARCGVRIPLVIIASNPGMWGRAPANDTCFTAASLVKNTVENRNGLIAFVSGPLLDFPPKLLPVKSMYHGGTGAITYNGIPKAAYMAMKLLSEIRGEAISERDGYLLTRTEDKREFYLLLYYYCPYELSRHRSTALSPEEECTYDRYYEFKDSGAKSVRIFLSGVPAGKYTLETQYINRKSGSSYDIWMQMGAPRQMKQQLLDYLEASSMPAFYLDEANVTRNGKLVLSVFLEPLEVKLIHGIQQIDGYKA